MNVCSTPGCPTLVGKQGRCLDCRRDYERARGTKQERGYGAEHNRLRRWWAPQVAAGHVRCWRCGDPLDPNRWHLGHDDDDRDRYRGPECVPCNTATTPRKGGG